MKDEAKLAALTALMGEDGGRGEEKEYESCSCGKTMKCPGCGKKPSECDCD